MGDDHWRQCSNEVGTQEDKKRSRVGYLRSDTEALVEQRKKARVEVASGRFNFMFHELIIEEVVADGPAREKSAVITEFRDHVLDKQGPFFELVRLVTSREPRLQTSRIAQFFPGDFLAMHSDGAEYRSIGYVFQFSKD